MKSIHWQTVSKLALALTAALGIALATNVTSHASRIQSHPVTQQVQKRPVTNSQNQPNVNSPIKAPRRQVGHNQLIHHHIHLSAKAAVAIDGRTGQVVYQKNANQKRLVASTGKLMTLYLAEKKLTRHPKAWNRRIHIPRQVVRMGNNPEFDAFHYHYNRKYRLGNVFKSAFIASDDNSAITLGQWAGGSNRNFIRMMNHQARKWHLRADFTSASGLENDDLAPYGYWVRGRRTSGNLISAKSLGLIAFHLIRDFPQVMKFSRIRSTWVDGQKLVNENRLLPGESWYRHHLHTDGLKTGYTPRSGLCFVGTGKRPGKDRLITVVLNDPSEFSDTDHFMNDIYKYSRLYNK